MSTREEELRFFQKFNSCVPARVLEGIDMAQRGICCVLGYLKNSDGEVLAGDLAKELNVSSARISALLKKMEKKHFLIRRNASDDARKTVVEITPEGIDYIDAETERILSQIELLIEKVGQKDLDEFIRISYKIRAVLDE